MNLNNPPVRVAGHGQRDARPQGPPALSSGGAGPRAGFRTRRPRPPTGRRCCARPGSTRRSSRPPRPRGCRRSSAMCARHGPASTRIGRTFRSASKPRPGAGSRSTSRSSSRGAGRPSAVPAGRPRVTAARDVCVRALLRGRARSVLPRAAQPPPQPRRRGGRVQAGAGAVPDARRRRADDGAPHLRRGPDAAHAGTAHRPRAAAGHGCLRHLHGARARRPPPLAGDAHRVEPGARRAD